MFKIEPAEQRDTFRIRSTQHPAIVFEVSAITKDTYEFIGDFRERIKSVLSEAPRADIQRVRDAAQEIRDALRKTTATYTAADNLADLLKIVIEMRAAQKAYFRNKKTSDLEASKLLERKLDALAAELSKGAEVQPPTLF